MLPLSERRLAGRQPGGVRRALIPGPGVRVSYAFLTQGLLGELLSLQLELRVRAPLCRSFRPPKGRPVRPGFGALARLFLARLRPGSVCLPLAQPRDTGLYLALYGPLFLLPAEPLGPALCLLPAPPRSPLPDSPTRDPAGPLLRSSVAMLPALDR